MSLIARMIIPISVIVTLATSFIGWKAYSDARDSVAEATRILEISTLDAVGRELTTVMNLTRQHLLTVADRIAIIELLRNPDESPEGERSKLLTRHLRRAVFDFPSIDGLAVLNSRGTVIASVNPGENATSRKTSSYFHKALQGAQTLDGPLVLPYTQEKAFIISTPIYDRGKVSGVLVGAINMEHLTRLIVDPVTLNGMGYVFVCTPGGSVIMHRDRNKMFADNVSEQRFIKEATADKDRFLEYRNPQGQIMYSAYTALPNGWIIVAAASKEAMLAGVRNLRSDIILSCVGALLLVTLLIYLILRKVTGVLQEGVEFAERVASGDLDRSLNIRREDELGKLARALNTMVQRLKASFSMAEERAREAEEASARATETSQELEAVINGVRGGVARLELTDNLRVLWANAGFYALAGRSHAEYEQDVHDEALLVVHPDDRAHLLGAFRSSLASNIPVHTEYRILRRDGGVVWIYLQASLVGHRDGVPVFQGVFVDVSKQKNTMRALELEQQRNRIVAELTNDIIFEYDYDTDEMTCSERYETIFHKPRVIPNYRRHQDNLLNMLLPEDAKTLQEAYRRIEQGVDSYALTLRLLQPEAGYQWYSIRFRSIRDETGRAIKLIGQLTNIHHQKLEEDRLRHEASTDLLTQIYNKITTEHLVSLELQEGRNHALIVVDLDKFKYANDTFGHLFGDSVIKAVAATLRATFRATDIVGRTGGDEFVVLAKDISLSDGLETLKAKCRRLSVELAHVSLGQDYVISASIGISLFPRDGKTYAELFAKADAALYQIKNTGRGHFAEYGEVPETETKALPSGGKGMPLMPRGPRNDA